MDNLTLLTQGFNAGYLLQKHNPKLSRLIEKELKDKRKPFAVGFIAGTSEYFRELGIEKRVDRGLEDDFEYE